VTIVRARYWNRTLGARRYLLTFAPDSRHPLRRLWSIDGAPRSAAAAVALIDRATSPRLFYALDLSPDPRSEDADGRLDLQEVTSQSLRVLARRRGCALPWVAAEDHEHGRFRHVHVLVVSPRRLRPDDLAALAQAATAAARDQHQPHHAGARTAGGVPTEQLLQELAACR
jgi:hypothetical protein